MNSLPPVSHIKLSAIEEANESCQSSIIGREKNESFELVDPEYLENFNNSHQQPNSSGFVAWVEKIIDYFSGVFGERMTAPELNAALFNIFSSKNDWQPNNASENEPQATSKKLGGTTYVVSAVSHDRPDYDSPESIMTGAQPVATTLDNIQNKYSKGDVKVLIPIAQANNYGPSGVFGMRGHLVLLEADIKDGVLTHATLHDSKGGLLDHIYHGADRLNTLLQDKKIQTSADFSLNVEHRGEQSLFNGKDCGRFTAYYAHKITEKGNLNDASRAEARAFFDNNFGVKPPIG